MIVVAYRRSQWNELGYTSGSTNHGLVTVEKGFHDDNLVTRIDMTLNGTVQSFVRACRHQDLLLFVNVPVDELRVEILQSLD